MHTSLLRRTPRAAIAFLALPVALAATRASYPPVVRASRPAGTYVLTTAAGRKPPVHFALPMAGTMITGTVDGARVSLDSAGGYSSDVVVRWENAPVIPMLGLDGGRDPRTLHGTGHYTQQGDRLILTPDDWMTRRLATELNAHASDSTLRLISASGGAAGNSAAIDIAFKRIR